MSENQQAVEGDLRPQEIENLEPQQEAQTPEPSEDDQRVPLKKFVEKKHEAKALKDQLDEQTRQLEALKQQQELYKMSASPVEEAVVRPSVDDYYDDPEAYNKAMANYESSLVQQATAEAQKMIDNRFSSLEQQKNVEAAQAAQKAAMDAHYDRADKLNASDFLEVEEKVKGRVNNEIYSLITGYLDNSEHVIYAMGGDLSKADDIQAQMDRDPIKGFMSLMAYADSLKTKNTNQSLPEPDEPLKGGLAGVVNIDSQLEKLREQHRTRKISTNEFMEKKRALSA